MIHDGVQVHGDAGLVNALYDEMTVARGAPLRAGLGSTVHSHLIAFAAEEARVTGRTVDVEGFSRRESDSK